MVKIITKEKVQSSKPKGKKVLNNPIKKKKVLVKKLKTSKKTTSKKSIFKKKKEDRGVVYLSHIPHGFYDEQIKGYFSQFGQVTQVSLPKSKSGRIKGYAFIEFKHPEVAEIAAETMNNYLMFNKLLKAKYIPPEEQKSRLFKKAEAMKKLKSLPADRASSNLKEYRTLKNRMLKTSEEAKLATKLFKRSQAMAKKMEELGIAYEAQIEQGNIDSVLERKKNLIERRKLERQEAKSKLEENDANSSSNETCVTPLVVNPSKLKLESDIKSATIKKIKPIKSNDKQKKLKTVNKSKLVLKKSKIVLGKKQKLQSKSQKENTPLTAKLSIEVKEKAKQKKIIVQDSPLTMGENKTPLVKLPNSTKMSKSNSSKKNTSKFISSPNSTSNGQVIETTVSPKIKTLQKTKPTPSKKSPKSAFQEVEFNLQTNKHSLGKSPKRRKSQIM